MTNAFPSSADLAMSPVAASQFCYHVRTAAMCAAAGQADESASEAVLAWTMLNTCWPAAQSVAAATAAELIDPVRTGANGASFDRSGPTDGQRSGARSRAYALALSLQSHFVSVGLHEQAALYESVADQLESTIATLASDS